MKDKVNEVKLVSLKLLEENWNELVKKVINPLWQFKFKTLYTSVKLDKNDFISLAGEELTKAFAAYNPAESNIYTYAKIIISKKASTEVRNKKREKRKADFLSESIYQNTNNEGNGILEEVLESVFQTQKNEEVEAEVAIKEIYKLLKPREKRIVALSIKGLNNKDIAEILSIKNKEINALRRKLSEASSIRKALRMMGYLGGVNDEI